MGSAESFAQGFVDAVAEVAVVLDERAHRLLLGAAARQLGRGGITLVAAAAGASPDTVGWGAAELEAGVVADGRVRVKGAGRKTVENAGREYQPGGAPEQVDTYDFLGPLGKVAPYGVFDVGGNSGWVNVGTDADTGAFAVESIRRWWNRIGQTTYPTAGRLLITADGGGSNGSRLRLWKTELAAFATEAGLEITVLHFPPGTSKWNRTGCSPRSP